MAFRSGIFSRAEAHGKRTSNVGRAEARELSKLHDVEYAVLMGPKYANEHMNPDAKNPGLAPKGTDQPVTYLLRDFPSSTEDRQGRAWSDGVSDWIKECTRCSFIDELRAGYVCPTYPGKSVKDKALDFYSKSYEASILEDIEKSAPKVVVTFGKRATALVSKSVAPYGMGAHGQFFPVQIGEHRCFVMPMPDPVKLFRAYQDVENGPAARRYKRHSEIVVWFAKWLQAAENPPKFPDTFMPELPKEWIGQQVDVVYEIDALKKHFKAMRRSPFYCLDLETEGFRALRETLGILCFGFTYMSGDKYVTFAFGWNHPDHTWSPSERAKIDKWIRKALSQQGQGRIAHNTSFELQWLRAHHDPGKSFVLDVWEDTFLQSHTLGTRTGMHSLDFRTLLYFGLPLKAQSDVKVGNLKVEPLDDVCSYCGLDTYWALRVWEVQSDIIEEEGLDKSYYMKLERLAMLADMHLKGFNIDQEHVRSLHAEYTKEAAKLRKRLRRSKEVRKYERNHSAMNFMSSSHLLVFIRETLGHHDETSADLPAQRRVAATHPIMNDMIEYRGLNKLISTYLKPYLDDDEHTVIYPDGRIHPIFNPNGAATGRMSAEEPSVQNIPARTERGKRLRRSFIPDVVEAKRKRDRHVLLASDYGQLEARVICMASRDKVYTKALINDLDIHLEWSHKIAEAFPEVLEITHAGNMKSLRSAVKNQVVFPLFYGSSKFSIARSLQVDPDELTDLYREFWDTFSGVARWQKTVTRGYQENGYVESMTGDRRYGPLDYNAQINTPIQGPASHIVVRAGVLIRQHAQLVDKPWRAPQLNIHDDMVWSVPEWDLDDTIDAITKIQVSKLFRFQRNVPLTVNPAVGRSWDKMKEIGEIRSTY